MNNQFLPIPSKSDLTPDQVEVISSPIMGNMLITGEAGTGKTTTGSFRLRYLAEQGVPGDSILILVPQRSLAAAYYSQIHDPTFPSSNLPTVLTFGGLAQRMISLFWPVIARNAGFASPSKACKFLTLETAQYYMATLLEPYLKKGYFESLTIDPNRLYSQILDNLNKSAAVGFPPSEIASRLTQAWAGKPSQTVIYQQSQECALIFREFCYKNNLLDFSLQLSVFTEHLWPSLVCRKYLQNVFQHLIYDNIEEDIPVAHDLIEEWLPTFKSALLLKDSDGGFRSFLAADPVSSDRFVSLCATNIYFSAPFVKTPELSCLESSLSESLELHKLSQDYFRTDLEIPFSVHSSRFYPEMMDWVTREIQNMLTEKSASPADIAILTPFLSDSLRFAFTSRLLNAGIPITTYRPSRSPRDEPAVQTILTLAKLAHTGWDLKPTQFEVRNALSGSIVDCDLIRAHLLTEMLYKPHADAEHPLKSFDPVIPESQERITYTIGQRYEHLRYWLFNNSNDKNELLDHWMSRLFGEVLSQPGYGFHDNFDAAAAVSRFVESFRKFRQVFQPVKDNNPSTIGEEYIRVVEQGILAAQSLASWSEQAKSDAVFLSPAFSFLMVNRPVRYQFWIDIGSQGWWSRLEQPLTQPFVLNRNWITGKLWTDAEEYSNNQKTLARLTTGLIRRCSMHIFMCTLGYNEQGLEERGALVMAMQSILRQINLPMEEDLA